MCFAGNMSRGVSIVFRSQSTPSLSPFAPRKHVFIVAFRSAKGRSFAERKTMGRGPRPWTPGSVTSLEPRRFFHESRAAGIDRTGPSAKFPKPNLKYQI